MSRPSITRLPSPAIARCRATRMRADGGEPRHRATRRDRSPACGSRRSRRRRRWRPASRRSSMRARSASAATAGFVVEGDAALDRGPGHRAIHRAGVHVPIAERLRDLARHRALARARRAVNRDHHAGILPLDPPPPRVTPACDCPGNEPSSFSCSSLLALGAWAAVPVRARGVAGRPRGRACTGRGSIASAASRTGRSRRATPTIPGRGGAMRVRVYEPATRRARTRAAHRRRPRQGDRRAAADEAGARSRRRRHAGRHRRDRRSAALPHHARSSPTRSRTRSSGSAPIAALAPDGRLGVIGVSFAGGLSIVAAGRPHGGAARRLRGVVRRARRACPTWCASSAPGVQPDGTQRDAARLRRRRRR